MNSRPPNAPALLAPGATSHGVYAPAKDARLPAVDDRLVAPESDAQIIDGRVIRTMGSNQPHGTRHFEAAHVFAGALADGYTGAVDMLTRADADTDAAPDISVFPSAPDAKTGGRQLEEIAVEVLDTERLSHATEKAEKLAARGVRRLFCVKVPTRRVYEWSHANGDWEQLAEDAVIEDRCLRVPVPVEALVDRVLADDTVARALLASRNRVLERALSEREREGRKEGREEGALRAMAEAVLTVLDARGMAVSDAVRERVRACRDRATLERWQRGAVTAASADAAVER